MFTLEHHEIMLPVKHYSMAVIIVIVHFRHPVLVCK